MCKLSFGHLWTRALIFWHTMVSNKIGDMPGKHQGQQGMPQKKVWNMPYIGGREGSYSKMYLWHSNTIKDHFCYVRLVKLLMPNPVTVPEVQFYIYTKGHKMPFLKTRNTQKRLTWLVTEPTDFPPLSPEAATLIFSFPSHGLPSVMS